MLRNFLKYFKYGIIYAAIEHQNDDEKEQLALLVLKKKKNEFRVENQKLLGSIKEVEETIPKNQHLYLVVNNNQVLSKSINKELSADKALQKSFPTIRISDFYYELIQLKEKTLVSICRKDYIHKLIDEYTNENLNIIGFTLGNNSIVHLLPFIENNFILTSNASFVKNNDELISYASQAKKDSNLYSINGLEITNNYILPLASILSYFTNAEFLTNNFQGFNESIKKQYSQKRFFNIGLKTGLGVLFISLLINFLIFDYFNKKITNLSHKAQINQSYKEQLLLLNNTIGKKKKMVDDIVNSSTSKTSLYFDKIGATVPGSILLISMNYQPFSAALEKEKNIVLNSKTIIIKGTSSSGIDFTNWVKVFENSDWIGSIEIIDYGIGKGKNTSFELKLNLE
jgi:hypothetical protein